MTSQALDVCSHRLNGEDSQVFENAFDLTFSIQENVSSFELHRKKHTSEQAKWGEDNHTCEKKTGVASDKEQYKFSLYSIEDYSWHWSLATGRNSNFRSWSYRLHNGVG